jgi:hypothetical protein
MNAYSRAALFSVSLLTFALHAPVSQAQAIASDTLKPTANASIVAEHVGPTAASLSVAVRAPLPAATLAAPRGNAGLGQSEAMMIVGGAAILVGAIVGGNAGDVFMIGGAVVGLYGLYKYLQ